MAATLASCDDPMLENTPGKAVGGAMLIGERVRLRGVERSDLAVVVGWMNDPATRAQIARSSPLSMAEEERWFDSLGEVVLRGGGLDVLRDLRAGRTDVSHR